MQKTKDENNNNPDLYLVNDKYITAMQGLATSSQQLDNLTKSTHDFYEQLKNIPKEAIDRLLEYFDALQGLEDANLGLREAQGEILTREDYTQSIENARSNIRTQEDNVALSDRAVEEAQAVLNFSRLHANDKLKDTVLNPEQAQINLENAMTASLQARTALVQAQQNLVSEEVKAYEAGQRVFEDRIALENAQKELVDADRELLEARGFDTRNQRSIRADITTSGNNRTSLREQLSDLETQHAAGLDHLSDTAYQQKHLEIERQIKAEDLTILNLNKELMELPLKYPKEALELIKQQESEIDAIVSLYKNLGREVPDNILGQKLVNIEEQRSQLEAQRDIYTTLINTVEGAVGSTFGSLFTKGWKQSVSEIDQELGNLQSEEASTNIEIANKNLTKLGYKMNKLNDTADKLSRNLNSAFDERTADDYMKSLDNMREKLATLDDERDEVNNLIALGPDGVEGGLKWAENDEGYQNLLEQLRNIDSEYDNLIESIRQMNHEMNNIDFTNAQNALSDYQDYLSRIQNELDHNVEMGYRMTSADYDRMIQQNANAQALAENAYREAYKRIQIAPGTNNTFEGIQKNSDTYRQLMSEANAAYDAWQQTIYSGEKTEREKELLPVKELQT